MNGYIAMYNGKKTDIHARTLYDAKLIAIKKFKVPKKNQHMVIVMLAEKDGKPVVHTPDF